MELTQGSETHPLLCVCVFWVGVQVVFFIRLRSPMELTQGSETQTPTVVSADPSKSVSLGSLGEWRGGILFLSVRISEN